MNDSVFVASVSASESGEGSWTTVKRPKRKLKLNKEKHVERENVDNNGKSQNEKKIVKKVQFSKEVEKNRVTKKVTGINIDNEDEVVRVFIGIIESSPFRFVHLSALNGRFQDACKSNWNKKLKHRYGSIKKFLTTHSDEFTINAKNHVIINVGKKLSEPSGLVKRKINKKVKKNTQTLPKTVVKAHAEKQTNTVPVESNNFIRVTMLGITSLLFTSFLVILYQVNALD